MDATTQPDAERRAADLRTLQLVWGALVAGVALMAAVLGTLTFVGYGPGGSPYAETLFYANALLNLVAVVVAFAVQRRLVDRLTACGTYAEVVAAIRTSGVLSLAVLEGSAIVAGIAAFLTGQLVNLLFVVPFFGFALVFFPTASRITTLLDVARRG